MTTSNLPPNLIDAKDFLPSSPVQIIPRPNTEELRKEVEAMMASFQPQPIENQQQQQQQQQQQHQQQPIVLSLPSHAQVLI
jgi:hypothetical protein